MSTVLTECNKMLVASEVGVINRYFKQWLKDREVVVRVAKSVIIDELNNFTLAMCTYYDHGKTDSTILDGDAISMLIDNAMRDTLKDGLRIYHEAVKVVIAEMNMDRITLNKLTKKLDEYALYLYTNMVNVADKGALW